MSRTRERARTRRHLRRGLVFGLLVLGLLRGIVPTYADARLHEELEALGLGDVTYELESVSHDRLVLGDVRVAPDLRVARVVIRFDPLELADGHVESIELHRARWDATLDEDALRASAVARILTAGPEGASAMPDRVIVRDSEIVCGDGSLAPRVRVSGDVTPVGATARLRVASPFGRHDVHVTTSERAGDTHVRVVAVGESCAEDHVDLSLTVPGDEARPVALSGRAHLASLDARAMGLPLALRELTAAGDARFTEGRLAGLELRARAASATGGPVALSALRLTAAGTERVAFEATAGVLDGGRVDAHGELTPIVDPDASVELAWSFSGPAPEALVSVVLPNAELSGALALTARGRAVIERGGTRFCVRDARVSAHVPSVAWPSLSMRGVTVALRASGALDDGHVTVALEPGSRIFARRVASEDRVGFGLEARPELAFTFEAGATRVHGDGVRLRARALHLGDGPHRLELGALAASLRPRRGRPLLTDDADGTRADVSLRARARNVDGAVIAREMRARALVRVDATGAAPRVHAPVALSFEHVAHTTSGLSLDGATIEGPVDVRGTRFTTRARLRADDLTYGGHGFGATDGRLRAEPGRAELVLSCLVTERARARLAISLLDGPAGSVDLDVPPSDLDTDTPLSRVLADLTGFAISGTTGGDLHIDLQHPELATARLAFEGARVAKKGGASEARGVHGTLDLTQLDPPVGQTRGPLRFDELVLDGTELAGAGSARMSLSRAGAVRISDLRAELGGGEATVAPFVIDPTREEVLLRTELRGLDLAEVLPALSDGAVRGTGIVDGHVVLRARYASPARVRVLDGHLAARGAGRLRFVGDDLLAELRDWAGPMSGSVAPRRVVAALADFDYSLLTVDYGDREDPHRITAHVVGDGRAVRQGVDLTLRVRGAEALLEELQRVAPEPS